MYTRPQRAAVLFLLALLGGATLLRGYLWRHAPIFAGPAEDDTVLLQAAANLRHRLDSLAALKKRQRKAPEKRQRKALKKRQNVPKAVSPSPITPFPFDPNTLPPDSLLLLGLTERETRALVNYRSYRPRTFSEPEDLLRLRALTSVRAHQLLPYVRIAPLAPKSRPPQPPKGRQPLPTGVSPAPTPLNLNTATLESLQTLPGIGPARARRILAFRDALGGFHHPDQLAETYGLPDSTFDRLRPHLRTGTIIRPLPINLLDAEGLARHPYLDRRLANIIVRYRDHHGPFAGPDELKNIRALSAETLKKLLPYLNFDR